MQVLQDISGFAFTKVNSFGANIMWAVFSSASLLHHFKYDVLNHTQDSIDATSISIPEKLPPFLYSPHGNALNPKWVRLVGEVINYIFLTFSMIQGIQLLAKRKNANSSDEVHTKTTWVQIATCFLVLDQLVLDIILYAFTKKEFMLSSIAVTITVGFLQIYQYRTSPIALASGILYWITNFVVFFVIIVQDISSKHKIIATTSVELGIETIVMLNSLILFVLNAFYYKPGFEIENRGGYSDDGNNIADNDYKSNKQKEVDVISYFTFRFIQPVIDKVYKTDDLSMAELPDVLGNLKCDNSTLALKKNWEYELNVKNHLFAKIWLIVTRKKYANTPSLFSSIYKTNISYIWGNLLFSFANIALTFAQPFILKELIEFFAKYLSTDSQNHPPIIVGYFWAVLMFIVATVDFIVYNQAIILQNNLAYAIRSSLTVLIYEKALKLSPASKKKKPTGDIINSLSVDIGRINGFTMSLGEYASSPIKLVICLVALYRFFGFASFFGLGAALISVPLITLVNTTVMSSYKQLMKDKDDRTSLIKEIVNLAKSIKLYSWETPMLKRLNHIRNDRELQNMKKIGVVVALAQFLWSCVPFIISCACFAGVTWLYGLPLTPEIVFPALTLFGLLMEPMMFIPHFIINVLEVAVSLGRLTELLTLEEISPNQNGKIQRRDVSNDGKYSVLIKNADFVWDDNNTKEEYKDEESEVQQQDNENGENFALKNVNFYAIRGKLTCIVGRVGSGKSTLLDAILGDVPIKTESRYSDDPNSSSSLPLIETFGNIAYCPQAPWILNGTIKDNILFGHKYDSEFYRKTIVACQLVADFQSLELGDKTLVGEKGISLSGGQKARISLARAVYAREDIYLLDDVLSAVDAHVGKALMREVLSPQGIIGNRTKILATNSVPVLHMASDIFLLSNGSIIEHGDYDSVVKNNGELAKLVEEFGKKAGNNNETDKKSDLQIEAEESWSQRHDVVDEAQAEHNLLEIADTPLEPSGPGVRSLRRASVTSFDHVYDDDDDDEDQDEDEDNEIFANTDFDNDAGQPQGQRQGANVSKSVRKTPLDEEEREKGAVPLKTFVRYAKECNYKLFLVFVVCILANSVLNVLESYILKYWSNLNKENNATVAPGFYLGLYFATGAMAGVVIYIGYYILWSYCIIKGAAYFHNEMAKAILRSPMSFIETTPVGRILNRFTQDIDKTDMMLPFTMIQFIQTFISAIVTFLVIVLTLPMMLVIIVLFSVVYNYYRVRYIPTSRELKRLQSTANSPVLAIIQETLAGVDTIKAFQQKDRFIHKCKKYIDERTLVNIVSVDVDRWLSMRLQSISSLILFATALFAVWTLNTKNPIDAALLGFLMTFALNVAYMLSGLIRSWGMVQANGVALERIIEYCDLPSEGAMIIEGKRPNAEWPAQGVVEFKDYSTAYREYLPPVLKQINLKIEAKEKVGIVGRTGAGKSSLTLALFRIIEATGGYIEIDGVNVNEIGLYDLRHHLTIIPQEAHTFRASVRENLDPFGEYTDEKLWKVLELAHLKEHVESMETDPTKDEKEKSEDPDELPKKRGLDAHIEEGGANLSAGQKQLLCLARALLNETSKILVLDEATAAVDFQTDKIIQETIREQFKDKTILTIAHRIDTIMDSDKILVLDKGEVAEFDTPQNLLKNKQSIFYSLASEGGYLK